MDHGRWKKLIMTGWWSGWCVGLCFFWYRLKGQRAVKRLLLLLLSVLYCVCICACRKLQSWVREWRVWTLWSPVLKAQPGVSHTHTHTHIHVLDLIRTNQNHALHSRGVTAAASHGLAAGQIPYQRPACCCRRIFHSPPPPLARSQCCPQTERTMSTLLLLHPFNGLFPGQPG